MTTQPEALRLAAELDAEIQRTVQLDMMHHNAAAELRRLRQHELANEVWQVKTQWVQDTAKPEELGMHRADVMRQRLVRAEAQRDALLEALRAAVADWDEEVSRGRWLDAARAAIKKAEEA